jgi:DNA primase
MPKISNSSIQQIKARAEVLDVVSEVVQLKQRGRNYFGLCPFHEEKTPSFSVNPALGIFHCFGCGKGGNAVTFVMEYEKIEYVEALKRLAERYGIQIEYEKGADDLQKGDTALLYELHGIAMGIYQEQLFSDKGQQALEYLEKRRFSKELLNQFSIGYATDEWDSLIRQVDPKRFSAKVLEQSGLFVSAKERNRLLDRFRNRIMFPIFNLAGRVVAFGGRTLDPKEDAKYLNSPETPIYFKSGTLYGLEHSKSAIQQGKKAILVEGYTDFLRIYSSGIESVVAGSGTALNFHHARVLKRFAAKIILCYDGDDAGQKATERAGFVLIKEGLDVRIIQLPPEDDPDSYLSKHTPDEFRKLQQSAPEFIDWFIRKYAEIRQTPTAKSQFVEQLVTEIVEVQNPVTRDFIVKEIAEKLDLREERIMAQVRRVVRQRKAGLTGAAQSSVKSAPELRIVTSVDRAEFELLQLMLTGEDELLHFIIEKVAVTNFQHAVLKNIAEEIYRRIQNQEDLSPTGLYDHGWTDEERFYLSKIIIESESIVESLNDEEKIRLVMDYITVMLNENLGKSIRELRIKIREAEKLKQNTSSMVEEHSKLQKRWYEIKSQLQRR